METFMLKYLHQTDNAILVYDDCQCEEIWLPKSQIEFDGDELDCANSGDIIELNIPGWLAEEKGLL